MKYTTFLIVTLTVMLCSQTYAGSATWNQNPIDNLWNTAGNWTPATVPNSETDVATFGPSNVTDIILGQTTDFDGAENRIAAVVFTPDAASYNLRSAPSQLQNGYYSDLIEFYGAGVVNNSDKVQHLTAETAPGPEEEQPGVIYFQNSSSVGDNVIITKSGQRIQYWHRRVRWIHAFWISAD